MKKHNKRELQNIATNHSADMDYKDFMKIYRKCTREPYSFLTIDTTLPASDPLRFRKIFSLPSKNDKKLMNLKFLMARLKQIKLSMIYIEKRIKFLHHYIRQV